MAKAEPIWELLKEAEDMVRALCQTYPEKFGHIDPDIIGCAAITGKDRPEGQQWDAKIGGIREPEALWSKKSYCIQFYKTTWEKYDDEHRQHMLAKLLERIPDDCDGKVLPEDLKDSYCFVKHYGPGYMDKPQLPNLIKQKQNFMLSIPEAKVKDDLKPLAIDDHKNVNVDKKA